MASPAVLSEDWRRMVEKMQRLTEQAPRIYPQEKVIPLSRQIAGIAGLREQMSRVVGQIDLSDAGAQASRVGAQIARSAEFRESARRVSEQVASLGGIRDSAWRISELNLTQERMRRLGEQIAASSTAWPAARAGLIRAVDTFEREAVAVGGLPETGEGPQVGWWLATRPLGAQLRLLEAGLALALAFVLLIEAASGEDIPDPIPAGAAFCLAMVTFLLVWLSERGDLEG